VGCLPVKMTPSPVPTAPVTRAISTGIPSTTVTLTPTATPSPSPTPTEFPPTATPSPPPPIITPAPLAPLELNVRWLHNAWDIVWDLDTGDLDGDGIPEIIVAAQDRKVHVLEPDGALHWQYEAQAGVYAVDVADLDGDGQPEVIIGADDDRVYVLEADGRPRWVYRTGGRVTRVLAAALDDDGPRVVVAGSWDGNLYLLSRDGQLHWAVPVGSAAASLVAADLDGDGRAEILAGTQAGALYAIAADGELRWRYDTGGCLRVLLATDLEGDGTVDVIAASADGALYVLDGAGRLRWRRPTTGPLLAAEVVDLEGDGRREVLIGGGEGRVWALDAENHLRWRHRLGSAVWTLRVADLDGDGQPEIAAGADDGAVYILDGFGQLRGKGCTRERVHGLVALTWRGEQMLAARSGIHTYLISAASAEPGFSPDSVTCPPKVPRPVLAEWWGPLPGVEPAGEGVVELLAVGDIMLARTPEERMEVFGSGYPFAAVGNLLRGADVAVGNLECALTARSQPIPHKLYLFRAHPRHVEGLVQAGFDVLILGNNHTSDYGQAGLDETVVTLRDHGLAYVGAGSSAEEAYRPLFLEVKGVRLAFLSYAMSSFKQVPWEMPPDTHVAYAEVSVIQEAVRQARQQADVVIVNLHAGIEYARTPSEEQRALAYAAADAGADLVIGHEPHVVQDTEVRGRCLIAWSLGDFVFDISAVDAARDGVILRALLAADGLRSAELIPVRIVDDVQPQLVADEAGKPIVRQIY
ncbi:MAG: CapA family protein, partial [Anaerolineae bacterium]|nr:CapA family protein [Anaerolineae bacterium]